MVRLWGMKPHMVQRHPWGIDVPWGKPTEVLRNARYASDRQISLKDWVFRSPTFIVHSQHGFTVPSARIMVKYHPMVQGTCVYALARFSSPPPYPISWV